MIKVYGQQNCMQCKMTKNFLEKENKEFEYVDLTGDLEKIKALKELYNKDKISLPLVVTDKEVWQGFRPDKLKAV